MKLYNIDPQNVYSDAEVLIVPGHEDRAIIKFYNHMSVLEFYPVENDDWRTDGSILLSECMGFDPEEFDPKSKETREWVEEWSYTVEMANAIVAQINQK